MLRNPGIQHGGFVRVAVAGDTGRCIDGGPQLLEQGDFITLMLYCDHFVPLGFDRWHGYGGHHGFGWCHDPTNSRARSMSSRSKRCFASA